MVSRPSGTENHEPRTRTRRAARGRRLSCPSPRTPRENHAYVPARTQTRAAPILSCAHVRLPCAGAPWPSRAARTSCAPLALPEPAACLLTPRRARRSTPHQHYLAFLRPVQALHTASGISQAAVPGRAASATQIRHRAGAHARPHARARAHSALCCTDCQPACTHSIQHHVHAYALTTQPAPHNNSLPHASPRRPALTPPAARSEKLQRAPLPTPAVSLHSETFSIHPAAAPPRAHSHRSTMKM